MRELIELRKELHKNPEISGNEIKTAKRVLEFLENYPPNKIIKNIGGNGILAIYEGKNSGKSVLFRCELDALPIQEINDFEHKSTIDGVSHKCGHDGHIAIICGLAKKLSKNPLENGSVYLLFQPAEETGNGAKLVLEDSKFAALQPDYVVALHNLPGFKKHQIIVKENTFSCAVNSIIIKLYGKTSHASEPENGINPALAIAEIIQEFNSKIISDVSDENFALITPIYINMGEKAYGVSAGFGEVHFTARSNNNIKMEQLESDLEKIASAIAKKFHLKINMNWTENFRANENNMEAVNFIRKAAKNQNLELLEKKHPFTFGEDFGIFTQNFKGVMFGLGSGENVPNLHNPDYDFPDEIIKTGVNLFHQISKEILNA